MQYLGGKARLAKRIAAIVDADRAQGEPAWDLCCGAGNVIAQLSDRGPRYGVDVVPSLVRLLCEVRDGTFVPPALSTEAMYADWKARAASDPTCDDSVLAFAGFGLSWGGKWFAGWARTSTWRVAQRPNAGTYHDAAARGLARQRAKIAGVEFLCAPWQSLMDRISGTVYIDPPYAGTTGYKAAPPHDPVAFWRDAAALAERDAVRVVYVSEYQAPAGWTEVARWEGQKAINRGTRVEKLFAKGRGV